MTSEEASPFLPELRALPGKDTPPHSSSRLICSSTRLTPNRPGIFHSLHCSNALRSLISKYMYNSTAVPELYSVSEIAHNEHCMDRIRQALICQGDLTPSTMYWWDGYVTAPGRTGPQTRRKWQPIRDSMNGREKRRVSRLE
jgi:hypothetical protein